MALFHIFVNLEDSWILCLLLHSICCTMLFWLKCREKIQPYTHMCNWKRRETYGPLGILGAPRDSLDHTLRTAALIQHVILLDFFSYIFTIILILEEVGIYYFWSK